MTLETAAAASAERGEREPVAGLVPLAGCATFPPGNVLDYRLILRDVFETRKAREGGLTYRSLAREFGVDTANMFRILNGGAHLPARCHSRAIEFLGYSGAEAENFLLLVALARERNPRIRAEILGKLAELRRRSRPHAALEDGIRPQARVEAGSEPDSQEFEPGDRRLLREIRGLLEDCGTAVRARLSEASDPEALRRLVRGMIDADDLLA